MSSKDHKHAANFLSLSSSCQDFLSIRLYFLYQFRYTYSRRNLIIPNHENFYQKRTPSFPLDWYRILWMALIKIYEFKKYPTERRNSYVCTITIRFFMFLFAMIQDWLKFAQVAKMRCYPPTITSSNCTGSMFENSRIFLSLTLSQSTKILGLLNL